MKKRWTAAQERLMDDLAAGVHFDAACQQNEWTREEGEKLRRNPAFQEEVLRRTEDRLAWMLPVIIRTLETQMVGADARMAQGAAKELLRRSDIGRDQQTGDLTVTFARVRSGPRNPGGEERRAAPGRARRKEQRGEANTDGL